MAKRRLAARQRDDSAEPGDRSAPLFSGVHGLDPISIATGVLSASVVYVGYYPSDSVSVEKGDALWFAVFAICVATIVWSVQFWFGTERAVESSPRRLPRAASLLLDIVPWLLALWMMVGAFATSPPGNLRMATNEAWLWVSAAAIFTASRRLMAGRGSRQAILVLMVACSVGLAVHGLHQYFVSLPQNRAEYLKDPERVLALAEVEAPEGSAERMVFENRLFDGGPTGTFALANSLAAALLVGVILSAGVLRFAWHELSARRRLGWTTAALLCATCLLAARSRSAALAMLLGAALIVLASSRVRKRNPKVLVAGLIAVLLVAVVGASFLALAGNREWFTEAPASLAFRFQYWRSTWNMALDHPLFAAGPGNFQSIYERYREASATEQIAEPHNLFFETLASGGFAGIGMLLMLIASGLIVITFGRGEASETTDPSSTSSEGRQRWVWLGAILSLSMIWLISWASRQTPDWQASLFVLPVSVTAAIFLWPSISSLADRELDSIVGIALVAISIHLMVAGGWTVPGVAMIVWLCAAMLTRIDAGSGDWNSSHLKLAGSDPVGRPGLGDRVRSGLAVAIGVLLLAVLHFTAIRPVEDQKRLMAITAMAQSNGQLGKARITLERAAEADPWSPDAMLWLADYHRWKLIADRTDAAARRNWEAALQEAKRRAGDDPAAYRMVGAQQLHVYQRHGNAADLAAAAETFTQAVVWSPSNQWMIAQMAVVAGAQGDTKAAQAMARRAIELSQLGGNIERAISRQQIFVARPLGGAANRGPIRHRADELLPEPNGPE